MSRKMCLSINGNNINEIAEKLVKLNAQLIEVRLDKIQNLHEIIDEAVKLVHEFSFKHDLIVTVRSSIEGGSFSNGEKARLRIISELIRAKPKYVDIELRSPIAKDVIKLAKENDVNVILSYHNFLETPNLKELRLIAERGLRFNSSLVKIVTMARSYHDNITMLRLVSETPGRVIGFCMGELGIPSRVLAPFFGAPFTYVSFGEETIAPGQINISTVREIWRLMKLI
ncbi:MAG: type I 3-dehydroquinate dehydratase [Thermoprotei archaeon]